MHRVRRSNDSVHWFMSELTSRIVAATGRPEDRFHIGKLILQSLKDAPDFILQIDGGTNESESSSSVLERSIRCAMSFKNADLKCGDVIVLMAPNHLDLAIPFYAALYLGIIIAPVDSTLNVSELNHTFTIEKPRLVFCQSDKAPHVQQALNEARLGAQVITFDGGDGYLDFKDFLKINGGGNDTEIESFEPANFDPEETIALLVPTSGTTGLPKAAAATHKNLAISAPNWWSSSTNFPTPTRMIVLASPLQWMTAISHFILTPVMQYTRLQTSSQMTPEHICHLFTTYRPTYTILSPTYMSTLLKLDCDLSSFELIWLGGSAVPEELLTQIKKRAPNADVFNIYGMSELTSIAFHPDNVVPGSCGKPIGCYQYRLVDIQTQEDVVKSNVQGELWMKGPSVFKEYYNNPEATLETFAEDRWLKTGDIFTRDENWNFFFVERYKLLLKYKSYHISPVELEAVIHQHPGVLDVAVTGIPDTLCGELPVACVVRRPLPQHQVTADQIKEMVAESLSEMKHLKGGVIFVDELPMTASTKIHRRKLKAMAMQMERE